jgi:transposase-like protein
VQRADELVGLSTLGGNDEWRSVMSQFASFETRLVLSQPTCPQCGARMWLARIEPDEPGHDKRTFECPSCEKVVSEIVKYR